MSANITYSCTSALPGVAFCWPNRGLAPFYIQIDPNQHPDQSADPMVMSQIFRRAYGIPVRVPPIRPELNSTHRTYDVTKVLPPVIPNKIGRQSHAPGTNCYSAAFCASGFEHTCDRYVDSSEAEFLLSLFYQRAPDKVCEQQMGSILIYTEKMGPSNSFLPMDITFMKEAPQAVSVPESFSQRLIDSTKKKNTRRHHFKINEPKDGMTALIDGFSSYVDYVSAGTHASFALFKDMVFHKASPSWHTEYEIILKSAVGKALDDAAMHDMKDPMERWIYTQRKHLFVSSCYARRTGAAIPTGKVNWDPKKRADFINKFDFYAERIAGIAKRGNSSAKFDKERMSLLTMENLWKIFDDFRNEVKHNRRSFLMQDWGLAVAFYRAYSLSWQYQFMSDVFYPIRPNSADTQLKRLYTKHYLKVDPHLTQEIFFHLKIKGVPRGLWEKIASDVIGELTRQTTERLASDPNFHRSNGTNGIPFFEILDAAIKNSSN